MSLNTPLHDIEQEIKCSVCMEYYCQPVTLLCQHTFCKQCLLSMHNRKCPICKLSFVVPREYNRTIDTIVSTLFPVEYENRNYIHKKETLKQDMEKEVRDELHRELYNQTVEAALEEYDEGAVRENTHQGSSFDFMLAANSEIEQIIDTQHSLLNITLMDYFIEAISASLNNDDTEIVKRSMIKTQFTLSSWMFTIGILFHVSDSNSETSNYTRTTMTLAIIFLYWQTMLHIPINTLKRYTRISTYTNFIAGLLPTRLSNAFSLNDLSMSNSQDEYNPLIDTLRADTVELNGPIITNNDDSNVVSRQRISRVQRMPTNDQSMDDFMRNILNDPNTTVVITDAEFANDNPTNDDTINIIQQINNQN